MSDFNSADDSAVAASLAHALFEDAFRREAADIGPFWKATNQLVAQQFANDFLRSLELGGSTSFKESFLRTWYTTHHDALTKTLAGAERRPDAT